MIKIQYTLPSATINCPYCKMRITITEIKEYRKEYALTCPHCESNFRVKHTLKIKHKVFKVGGKKVGKTPRQLIAKENDELWAKIVKARAGYKCEVNGSSDQPLNAHHIITRANKVLRWDLDNGISLTAGNHKFFAQGTSGKKNLQR